MKQYAVTVKFGPVLGPRLENAARATGRSRNAIVRDALERHLDRRPVPWLYQGYPEGSFLESAVPGAFRAMKTIVDTGPLVAYFCAGDEHHAWSVATLDSRKRPLLTC